MTSRPGDPRDLSAIGRKVRAFVRQRLGEHALDQSDDIAQDSFLLALRRDRLERVDTTQRLNVVRLRRIATLRILGSARAAGREVAGDVSPLCGDSPDANVQLQELWQAASQGLSRLRPDHHWVLLLRDVLGVGWETTVFMLDQTSLNSARCLHGRARRTLCEDLGRSSTTA